MTGTHFDVHTKKPFRKRAASDRRLHDSVYLFIIFFFSRRLLVLKNDKIELHSYIALPCKRLQTVENKTTIIFTYAFGASGQLLALFLSNSSLSSSTSHSILARQGHPTSVFSLMLLDAVLGYLEYF